MNTKGIRQRIESLEEIIREHKQLIIDAETEIAQVRVFLKALEPDQEEA